MKKMYGLFLWGIAVVMLAIPAGLSAGDVPTGRYYWIRSEKAVRQGQKGFWDLPGSGSETKNKKMQVWDLDNGSDRKFRFIKKQGSDNSYAIRIGNGQYVALSGFGNGDALKARKNPWYFQIEHVGGGRYRIKAGSKVVALQSKSIENGKKVHIWDDHSGPQTRWVFYNTSTRRSYVPQNTSSNSNTGNTSSRGTSITLQKALSSSDGYALKRYLSEVSMSQYMNQRGDGLLQKKLNQVRKYSDQWVKIKYALEGAVENRDWRLRRMVYSDLAKVNVKEASDFVGKALKGKVKSQINSLAGKESNTDNKKMIFRIANNF